MSFRDFITEKSYFRVGVIGYSAQKFDIEKANRFLEEAFNDERIKSKKNLSVVSGLTDLGIPALAYRFAREKGYHTAGIACSQAEEYNCFDVDFKIIKGDNWGDESETFLGSIDFIIRIGGGKQSMKEIEKAKEMDIPALEYELEAK